MAMAIHRHTNARLCSTFTTAEFNQIEATNTTTSNSAAAAHHFSCNRSSPDDLANLTTSAATLTSSAALIRTAVIKKSTPIRPDHPWLELNGCAHKLVAAISSQTATNPDTPPINHAAGRHRRERRYPVGKSSSKKASIVAGITEIQLESQASARPAGQDPGSATSACSAYWFEKPPRPSVSPANRNSQPIRFSGRLEASTKPITAAATFTTCPEMLETVQPVRLAGTRCRSTYASASPPPISATDPAAAHPATHRAVRALIRIPHPPTKATGLALALPHPRTARYAHTVPATLRLSTRTLQAGQAGAGRRQDVGTRGWLRRDRRAVADRPHRRAGPGDQHRRYCPAPS